MMTIFETIRIPYEDFDGGRFDCVGQYGEGNQFMAFVTGAFPGRDRFPNTDGDWMSQKSWNAVLHRFDAEGNHIGSEARRGGYENENRDEVGEKAWQHLDAMLTELSTQNPTLCDIYVKPFTIEIDEVIYELEYVHEIDEDGDENEYVMLWPNDIMFHPPWDTGEYST
jgi:hypothetical protein